MEMFFGGCFDCARLVEQNIEKKIIAMNEVIIIMYFMVVPYFFFSKNIFNSSMRVMKYLKKSNILFSLVVVG